MASQTFQIPGLTTLLQPQHAEEQSKGNTNTAAGTTVGASNSRVPVQETVEIPTTDNAMNANEPATEQNGKREEVSSSTATAMEIDQLEPIHQADSSTVDAVDAQPSPPSLTQGLEALLGGLDPLPDETDSAADQNVEMQDSEEQAQQPENVEWEEDSSPYASSSDSSSSDDSDDDDDSDDGQPLLNPEEMARILMEAGSDDEGEGKAKDSGAGCQLRTKNEQAEEVIPKPDVTITPEMKVEELGNIEHIVDNTVVIKANTTGEYRVLDAGSVLCNKERTVIAAIADLIGSVREPRYIARFTNEEEMKAFNLSMDTTIYYAPDHANFVFTEPLQAVKGTDASNWHDEEDDDLEFSDDEKEAAFKKEQKLKKRERRGAAGGSSEYSGRGGFPGPSSCDTPDTVSLNYDEDEEDGPYRPLARPAGYGQGGPPTNSAAASGSSYRGGRGDPRGRGRGRPYDRANRGRGQRGGPRGGPGYSLPPRPSMSQGQGPEPQQQQAFNFPPAPPQFGNQPFTPLQFPGAPGFQGQQAVNPSYPFPAWLQNTPQNYIPPPPPQFQQQPQGGQPAPFYNPEFFAALQNQLQGQQAGAQQPNHWPGQGGSG